MSFAAPRALGRGRAAILMFATALALAAGTQPAAADEAAFFFYSPDWRPGDLSGLTQTVETVLAREGVPVRFQAFARYEDFLAQATAAAPEFLVVPAWLHDSDALQFDVVLLARPSRNGKSAYRKALLARPEIKSIEDLSHGTIAAAVHAMGPKGARSVLDIFNLHAATTKVIDVPKDVDALFAVGFGQADAALVTSAQFDQITRSNPNVTSDLHVIALSPEIDFPGIYAASSADGTLRLRMAAALDSLNAHETGKALLEQLGYDALTIEPAFRASPTKTTALTRQALP